MAKSLWLPFAAIALFLVTLPAALGKPGLPFGLRADEGSYLAMANSLAFDQDLDCQPHDVHRLFAEFPFGGRIRLDLIPPAAGAPPRFGSSFLYPALAAPWVRWLGANGLLVFNMALFLLAVAIAARYLATNNEGALALTFAFGFFLFSPAFAYVFWHRSDVLVLALATVAALWGWPAALEPPRAQRVVLAGIALALAAFHQPFLLLLIVPMATAWWSAMRANPAPAIHRAGKLWGLALVLTLTLGGLAWLGWQPGSGPQDRSFLSAFQSPLHRYLLFQPTDRPWELAQELAAAAPRPFEGARLLGAFIDQRRGFLPYFPLAILALLLCRLPGRLRTLSWTLALLIAAQPWIGETDPELLANPALLALLPFFLLYVDHVPRKALVAGFVVGMLCAGPYLNAVLGALDGLTHGHRRAFPYRYLPLDPEEAHEMGGFLAVPVAGDLPAPRLLLPADVWNRVGDEVFLLGGEDSDFFLESSYPLTAALFQIRSVAAPNLVVLASEGQREELHFQTRPAITQRLLPLGPGHRSSRGTWLYPLHASAEKGAKSYWHDPQAQDATYVGVALAFLGTPDYLETDLYSLQWQRCGAPAVLRPGKKSLGLVTVSNLSPHPWPARGASQVRLATRWLTPEGQRLADNPDRTSLVRDLPPGGERTLWVAITAPPSPGRYQLEFDAVRENVAWFGDRRPFEPCRQWVEVQAQVEVQAPSP